MLICAGIRSPVVVACAHLAECRPMPRRTLSRRLAQAEAILSRYYATEARQYGQPLHSTHPHLFGSPTELTPGIPRIEFDRRRRKLMDMLPDQSVVLCCGSRLQYMSQSIFYKFRQATDFYYLTGFNEPDAAVVLEKNSSPKGYSMRLFCVPRDASRERWEGPRSGLDGAIEHFGADAADDIADLPSYLHSALNTTAQRPAYVDLPAKTTGRVKKAEGAKSMLGFLSNATDSSPLDILKSGRRKADADSVIDMLLQRKGRSVFSLKRMVEKLRAIKSSSELAVMRKAAEISSYAHAECMRFSRAGINESAVAAHFEYNTSLRGSERPAYVPVCASGASSLIIHYTSNDHILQPGQLLLMDAGCEFASYASDITRTYPVDGTFTSPQKDLYAAVLSANKQIIGLCTELQNYNMHQLHWKSCKILLAELKQIGFQLDLTILERDLFPHFISHPVGIDLHDTPSFERSESLKQGMVITVEPGLYVPFSSQWPKHFHGLGIRIEDEVAVGKDDYEVLSANCPKELVDVEAACLGSLDGASKA